MTARTPHPLIILKCWSVSFQALKDGSKRFEYRKDDRPYDVGVTVKQEEWNPDTEYTGDYLYHDITWIIRGGVFGIPEGYCIFSVTEPRKTQSHTSAPAAEAQQRIEQVIKELEKEKIKAGKEITHEFLDQDTYRQGIIWGCNKAIALLRGEGK